MRIKSFFESKFYNIITTILALVVVIIFFLDLILNLGDDLIRIFAILNNVIYIIFVLDYCTRLCISDNKRNFMLNNKIDLISILPFNSIFKSFRIARIVKVLKFTKFIRVLAFAANFWKRINLIIKFNNFNYVLVFTTVTIIIGAILISIVEGMSFSDSIWWSFVTSTTVGYGDISPSTDMGRIIASVLMLVGIGFISILTSTIATFFLTEKTDKNNFKSEILNNISEKIKNDFNDLTENDLDNMFNILKTLKNEKKQG